VILPSVYGGDAPYVKLLWPLVIFGHAHSDSPQIAGCFEPNTVFWAFHTSQTSSLHIDKTLQHHQHQQYAVPYQSDHNARYAASYEHIFCNQNVPLGCDDILGFCSIYIELFDGTSPQLAWFSELFDMLCSIASIFTERNKKPNSNPQHIDKWVPHTLSRRTLAHEEVPIDTREASRHAITITSMPQVTVIIT